MRHVHDRASAFVLSTFENYSDMPYVHFHELSFTSSGKPQKCKYSANSLWKKMKRKNPHNSIGVDIPLLYYFVSLFRHMGKLSLWWLKLPNITFCFYIKPHPAITNLGSWKHRYMIGSKYQYLLMEITKVTVYMYF